MNSTPPTFTELLPDVWKIDLRLHTDDRGGFLEVWRNEWLEPHVSPPPTFVQDSVSWNSEQGIIRGLHLQDSENGQHKIVSCLQGRVFDVLVDLRSWSPRYRDYTSVILDESAPVALYVPPGVAHGYQTLEPNSIIYYKFDEYYSRPDQVTINACDPDLRIPWPLGKGKRSDRDAQAQNISSFVDEENR